MCKCVNVHRNCRLKLLPDYYHISDEKRLIEHIFKAIYSKHSG